MKKMILKIIVICVVVLGIVFFFSRKASAETRLSPYDGWDNCVVMSNKLVKVVIVPGVARVLHFSLNGQPNILWEDAGAKGKLQKPDSETTGDYVNFGGAKLWVAPQAKWKNLWSVWPPYYGLDSGPCQALIRKDGSVALQGMASPTAGVRFDRQVDLRGNCVSFVYTMSNISDKPVEWGIWMVANVLSAGQTFIPFVEGSDLWSNEKDKKVPDRFGWVKQGDLLCLDFKDGTNGSKIFSLSKKGWIAHVVAGQVFIITYTPDLSVPQPEGEAPTEIFRGEQFVELEHVGPLVKLAPRQTTKLTERWYVFQAPNLKDQPALAAWVSKTAGKLK